MPAAGVPLSAPVAAVKVTPLGSVPLSVSVGAGKPLAATVKEPAAPVVKVALLALVLYPIVWLLSIPFRIVGITVNGVFRLLSAIFYLPVRLLRGPHTI